MAMEDLVVVTVAVTVHFPLARLARWPISTRTRTRTNDTTSIPVHSCQMPMVVPCARPAKVGPARWTMQTRTRVVGKGEEEEEDEGIASAGGHRMHVSRRCS